jgi:hypothetical protein
MARMSRVFVAVLITQVFWNVAAIDERLVREAMAPDLADNGPNTGASSMRSKLLRKMDKVVSADGTIIDNETVLYNGELSSGRAALISAADGTIDLPMKSQILADQSSDAVSQAYNVIENKNCWDGNGAVRIDTTSTSVAGLTREQCQQRCNDDSSCECVTHRKNDGRCWKRKSCDISEFVSNTGFNVYVKHEACYYKRNLVAQEGGGVGDSYNMANIDACKASCSSNSQCNSMSVGVTSMNCHLKDKVVTVNSADTSNSWLLANYKTWYKCEAPTSTSSSAASNAVASTQCTVSTAGQLSVYVPNCAGVGCNAGGQANCAFCVNDMAACTAAYGYACQSTYDARLAQGITGCQATSSPPATCNTMARCPVEHRLKANAAELDCAGTTCDDTVDAAQCCEAGTTTYNYECTPRAKCVDQLLPDLTSSQLVDFECLCNDHYMVYRRQKVWPSATDPRCKEFIACLNNEHGIAVKVLTGLAKALKDASTTPYTLVEVNESIRDSTCFTPSSDSYKELTECNCLKDLVNVCGDDAGMDPTAACLKNFACESDKVCDAWQTTHCAANMLELQAARATSDARDGSAVALETRARLDDTLQTKCA